MSGTERCGTCRFWLDDGGDPRMGLCRRYPRTVIVYLDTPYIDGSGLPEPFREHRYPAHAETDWCGEHEAVSSPIRPAVADPDEEMR